MNIKIKDIKINLKKKDLNKIIEWGECCHMEGYYQNNEHYELLNKFKLIVNIFNFSENKCLICKKELKSNAEICKECLKKEMKYNETQEL